MLPRPPAGSSAASASASRCSSVYDHVIVSTDFIKAERRRDDFVRTCPELVIVDEAHGFAVRRRPRPPAAPRAADQLADDAERHLILVTATPHSGKEDAFRSLLAARPGLRRPAGRSDRRRRTSPSAAGSPATSSSAAAATSRDYLDTDTPFPEREQADATYTLTPEYRRLFDRAIAYARETLATRPRATAAASASTGGRRSGCCARSARARRRGRDAPQPRARTPRRRTAEEADELGRRAVLDQAGDEDAESLDVAPGARLRRRRRRPRAAAATPGSRARARGATRSPASSDPKLAGGDQARQGPRRARVQPDRLLPLHPDRRLRRRAPPRARSASKAEVDAVTGTLAAGGARGARRTSSATPRAAGARRDRLPVSEGINLQEQLRRRRPLRPVLEPDPARAARGPRRPLRPARADRARASPSTARTTPIDGIVLDVLLRKHQRIRKALGVAVPVPTDSSAVIDAILEGLITRGRHGEAAFEQLSLDIERGRPPRSTRRARGRVAERRRAREAHPTMFAQHAIKPDEVHRELARHPRGDRLRRRGPPLRHPALRAYGATVSDGARGGLVADLDEVPARRCARRSGSPPPTSRSRSPATAR